MGIFSLNWFRSKKERDLDIEMKKVQIDILKKELREEGQRKEEKPYNKVKFVNDVLTVVLNDGTILNKPDASVDDFIAAREAVSERELFEILKNKDVKGEWDKQVREEERVKNQYEGLKVLEKSPDFEMRDGCVYMKGIDRSLPPLLVEKFAEIIGKYLPCSSTSYWGKDLLKDENYLALKKFWLKCCLNPNAQSAEDLYAFLSHHNFKISKNGNFFAYRRVQKVRDRGNDGLVKAISNAYNKVKGVWKKNPSDFSFYSRLGDYKLIANDAKMPADTNPYWEKIGNLKDLYLDLPNMGENRYTDAHTHSMDYRVGEIASIPRNECSDNNNVNCGPGLHCASKEYDYSGFGDTDVLMIVNPMDAVAVPHNEVGKMRVNRWFFAMTLDEGERYILDEDDFDVTDLDDIFEEKCLEDMEDHAHRSFAEEVKRHTFTIPKMSNITIKNIVGAIEDINKIIKNRVVYKK